MATKIDEKKMFLSVCSSAELLDEEGNFYIISEHLKSLEKTIQQAGEVFESHLKQAETKALLKGVGLEESYAAWVEGLKNFDLFSLGQTSQEVKAPKAKPETKPETKPSAELKAAVEEARNLSHIAPKKGASTKRVHKAESDASEKPVVSEKPASEPTKAKKSKKQKLPKIAELRERAHELGFEPFSFGAKRKELYEFIQKVEAGEGIPEELRLGPKTVEKKPEEVVAPKKETPLQKADQAPKNPEEALKLEKSNPAATEDTNFNELLSSKKDGSFTDLDSFIEKEGLNQYEENHEGEEVVSEETSEETSEIDELFPEEEPEIPEEEPKKPVLKVVKADSVDDLFDT